MKLYLKKDTSHNKGQFVVLDECCMEKYYVLRTNGYNFNNLKITDLDFNPLCKINAIPLPMFYAYAISDSKDSIKLIFNMNNLRPVAYYHGISWRICGDIINKNYEIMDSDHKLLLTHNAVWSRKSDGYEIEIIDKSRELFLLASVVCIDRIETTNYKEFLPI
jgi:uncharacterized protein YxjI